MLSRFKITDESYTTVYPRSGNIPPLVGQVQHSRGKRSAQLNYLLPELPEPHPGLPDVLDELAVRAGEMEASNMLAEVKENDPMLEVLRQCSFSIYGWETIWKLPPKAPTADTGMHNWEPMTSLSEPAVRGLYQTLVPPIVQAAEPYSGADVRRLIYRSNGELMAYVESDSGPRGIYLKPVFHPAVENAQELILELANIFQGLGKPLYLQMRSYQAWMTASLEAINAETTVHFALLVRRLTIPQHAESYVRQLQLTPRHTETPATIVQKITGGHK